MLPLQELQSIYAAFYFTLKKNRRLYKSCHIYVFKRWTNIPEHIYIIYIRDKITKLKRKSLKNIIK